MECSEGAGLSDGRPERRLEAFVRCFFGEEESRERPVSRGNKPGLASGVIVSGSAINAANECVSYQALEIDRPR